MRERVKACLQGAHHRARRHGQALATVALVLALALVGQNTGVLLALQPQNQHVLAVQPTSTAHDRARTHKKWKATLKETTVPETSEENGLRETIAEALDEAPDELPDEEPQTPTEAADADADTYTPETGGQTSTTPPMMQPATPALEAEDQEQPVREELGATNGTDGADAPETSETESETAAPPEEQEPAEAEADVREEDGTVLLTPEMLEAAGVAAGELPAEQESAALDADAALEEENCLAWLLEMLFGIKLGPVYSGWQTINDKTYYYAQDTNEPVTGVQVIDGKLYYFGVDGAQQSVTFGVDVSRYQKNIDWQKLKNAGVEFAIVRIGYRGYGSGTLVLDSMYETHMNAAKAAGLRTGIYFFSQAINEEEAIEEAEACMYVLDYYGHTVDYPIYFDSEYSNASHSGRADSLTVAERTACAVAFCQTIEKAGYKAGVYASTNWFKGKLDLSALSGYSLWNAHYSVSASPLACDIWQSTGTGSLPGIDGEIDIDVSFIG